LGRRFFLGHPKGVPFWWMIQRCWLTWSVAVLSLLFDILARRSNLHRQQSQFHDQGNR
jgi:hypothetical protein